MGLMELQEDDTSSDELQEELITGLKDRWNQFFGGKTGGDIEIPKDTQPDSYFSRFATFYDFQNPLYQRRTLIDFSPESFGQRRKMIQPLEDEMERDSTNTVGGKRFSELY